MATLIKRSQIQAFLNVGGETESYKIVGNGVNDLSYEYNPQETTETYIVNDNATTTLDSYQIALDTEMKCIKGDDIFDYIDNLRYNVSVGGDAKTSLILVDTWHGENGSYRAEKFECTISINSYGGAGGETPTIAFRIGINGDPEKGTATITTGTATFTPSIDE